MNISKTKFVFLFVISAFAFMFISNALFGTEPRVFPQPPESFLGADPQIGWKSVGYKILYPVKVVLLAPLLPFPNFLREDPPPPFVGAFFALYWSILALLLHYLIGRRKA